MNKTIHSILATCFVACGLFTSCSDDEKGSPTTPESQPVTEFDEVEYVQNSLVRVDEEGKFLYRVCGEPLDDADTTHLYVGVKDLAEAQELFRSLFPQGTNIEKDGDNLRALLKADAGTVQFTASSAKDGELGRVTFATQPALQLVSLLHIIDETAWPENDESIFVEGDKITLNDKDYICIRPKAAGKPSLFLHITPEKREPYDYVASSMDDNIDNSASNVTVAEANQIHAILMGDNGAKFYGFQEAFKRAKSELKKDTQYWIRKRRVDHFHNYYSTITVGTGQITEHAWASYFGNYDSFERFHMWMTKTINK